MQDLLQKRMDASLLLRYRNRADQIQNRRSLETTIE